MSAVPAATTDRRGLSIGAKLTLATLTVLVAVSVLLYRELTRRERESLLASKETAAAMVADLFAASLSAPLDFEDADAVKTELSHLETNPEVVCAAVFLRDATTPIGALTRRCDASAPIRAGDEAHPVRHEDRVEVARFVAGRGARVGSARVVFSLARENAAFDASRTRIFWLTLMLALGTAAVLIAVSRTQIVRPIHRLGDAARRVGQGDFSTRVVVSSNDELGQLASAFNRMSEEIRDRERRLAAVTQNLRELFEAMGQAIVAFDREGKVRGEVSREATKMFAGTQLEGRSVGELLFGKDTVDVEAQAFDEWRTMAFDVALDAWAQFSELAPHDITIARAGAPPVPVELAFRPVTKEGAIDRVMLLATDVSEKRRLEQAIDTQEEEHQKRMAAMRRLVAGGAQLFVRFLDVAGDRLARVAELGDGKDAVDAIFRHVHTLKGEARAFELLELEAALARVEDALARARSGDAHDLAPVMNEELARADAALQRARADFVAASPIGAAALEQVTVRRRDLDTVLALARSRASVDPLAAAAERLASRPFGEAVSTVAARAPEWAAREGKRVEIVVEGREVPVPAALASVLSGVMTHLVRNAIAHGIEREDLREDLGKPRAGSIWAAAEDAVDGGGPTITIEDDGAGIDVEALRERAHDLGITIDPDAEPLDIAFAPGLSTREGDDGLAGRGVGLDAVRTMLAEVGYAIHAFSELGRGTKFVLVPG